MGVKNPMCLSLSGVTGHLELMGPKSPVSESALQKAAYLIRVLTTTRWIPLRSPSGLAGWLASAGVIYTRPDSSNVPTESNPGPPQWLSRSRLLPVYSAGIRSHYLGSACIRTTTRRLQYCKRSKPATGISIRPSFIATSGPSARASRRAASNAKIFSSVSNYIPSIDAWKKLTVIPYPLVLPFLISEQDHGGKSRISINFEIR